MVAVVAHPKGAPDYLGNAACRPDVAAKAVRLGSAGEQARNRGPLLGRQAGGSSGAELALQRLRAPFTTACEPEADRGATDAQGRCNVLAPPTCLMQLPGALTPPRT